MPRILIPNLLLPASRKDTLRPSRSSAVLNMEVLNAVARGAHADGVGLTPGNFRHVHQLLAGPEGAQRVGGGVMSLLQSFVDTNPLPPKSELRQGYKPGGVAQRFLMRAVFSSGEASLRRIEKIRDNLGRDVPVIVYPDKFGRKEVDQRTSERFAGSAAIQLNADVLAAWRVDSPQGVVEELRERNFWVEGDSFNSDREGKSSTHRMSLGRYLPALFAAKLVRGIRIGVFRDDFKNVDPARYEVSKTEGLLLERHQSLEGTPLGDVFGLIHDHKWEGDITIAASLAGMEAAYQRRLTLKDTIGIHGAMVDAVRENENLSHIAWEAFPTIEAA